MQKKIILAVALFAMVQVIVLIGPAPITYAQFDCFHGYTYIDGAERDHVFITLNIDGHRYQAWSHSIPGHHGWYSIGDFTDTGDYCIKARTVDETPIKGDTEQGTKEGQGSIRLDFYLTINPPECIGTGP